jgi:uncharacterized protein YbaP (TraB family)
MNTVLRVLLVLCLLAAGTCVGMVATQRKPVPASTTAGAAATASARPATGDGKAAAAPAAGAAAGGKAAGNSPVPLLWKVSDGDNELYLLGSFHALRPSDYPLAPAVDAAFDDAELVVFELSPEEMNSPDLGMQMMQAAMDPDGLEASVDPATWKRLQAYAASRNLPVETFQSFDPWFVGLMISLTEMQRTGYDAKQGLDHQLMDRASAAHKRTMGLETGASQIAVLDGMSDIEQKQSLMEALDDAQDNKSMEELHDQWRNGDAAALESLLTVDFKTRYSSLYQRINVDRNQAWVPKLRALLDGGSKDDALVVVGTMHLLGPDGLVSQLKSKGYRVERL